MATASCIFKVDGTELRPYHIQVEQRFDWHHQFEVMVSTEKAKVGKDPFKSDNSVIDNAVNYLGADIELIIHRPVGTFKFLGVVTSVKWDQVYAGDSFIVFNGFSPTILIDDQQACISFEEKGLKEIVRKITDAMPGNLTRVFKPAYSDPIPYIVQYNETGYDFVCRIAMMYGEWFYFDGQNIIFGEATEAEKLKLQLGSDSTLSLKYSVKTVATKAERKSYSYQENDLLKQPTTGYTPGWLDLHGKKALEVSEKLYPNEEVKFMPYAYRDNAHVRTLAEAEKASTLSNLVMLHGQSAHPGVIVGSEVEFSSGKGFVNEYRVIGVTHIVDSHNDYYNSFEAIPVSSAVPPSNRGVIFPKAEAQIAEVVDNNDPEKLGRVRVRCKWQEDLTPWLRQINFHAGGDHGSYFVPEIGDEVLIDFEDANPDRPYILGSKYHGKIPPENFDKDNNLKSIKTRSGHTILFNDQDGGESITISDKNGNTINLDTSGKSIAISSESSVSISSNDITISANNNVTISAKNDISLSADNNVQITAKNQTNISGDSQANFVSKGSSVALTPADGKMVGKGKLEMSTNGTMKVGANGPVEVRGATIKLN